MKAKFSILTFPQQWQANQLTVRVVVMPRNLNPLQPIPLDAGVNAPAWPAWNMQLQAKLVSDGDKYPSVLEVTDTFDLVGISMPQNIAPIFQEMDAQLGGIPATNANNQLKPAKASDGAKKYLPESYRGSFNFTTPRTPDAVIDDSYKCALRDKPSAPFTPSGRDFLCWGKVFAHCLRQPALAKRVGFIYEATFAVDPKKLKNGSWIYIDFGPRCSFNTAFNGVMIAGIEKQKLVKRYAAKLPKLKPAENRSLFASVQFPVLIDGGVTLNNEDFPIAPKAFDDLIIEAAQYDDGFCKIVHAVQPVSSDLLREKEDKDLPVITDAGIRLGWDDEQILIWMNRQLKPDTSLLPAGRRTDAPIGVMQYRVDVRAQSDEAINPNPWTPLCKVRNKASLVMGGQEIDAPNNEVELGVEVYPAKPLPGQNFWLPQYFADWIGKSVVLPDKDAIEIFQKEKNTAPDRQAKKFDLYDEAGLEGTSLLYGSKYEFRVRLADISGGGPDVEDNRRYNAPSPEAKCHFKRYVQPQAVRLQNELPLRDDEYFNDDVLTMGRPLLGYPSVLFTGKYPAAVADLIADAEANLVESTADHKKQRPVGLADPDVVKVEILVEVKALEMDMQLRYDTDSHESYAKLYITHRNFPADFNGSLDVPITFVDAPVLNFSPSQDLGELGLVVGGDSIDGHDDIVLPRARDVRITLRAVAEGSNDYFANTALAKKGKPVSFIMRRVATNEEALFKELSAADYIRGIWLQPDADPYLKASTTEVFVENTSNQFITSMMDRFVDDIDKTLEVEAKGLSLIGKPGKRIQFGASRLIRHNLSPDSNNITFSTKSDLLNQWIVPITLILNRDWTWDGVKPVSFEFYRQVKFVGAGLTDEQREGIAWPAKQLVGDIEMKQAISIQALQGADRSQTYLCFLDAVEPKPKNDSFPEEMMVQYTIEPRFRLNENGDAIPTDEPLVLQLHLPMTGKPSQVPEIVSAGIAQSKYIANADYSGTEPRRRYLWIEFAEPLQNENDAYFIRMTAYAPDPLLAKWSLNMLEAIEEPPLPIDPELIRTISPQHSDDRSGLNAMQELIPANKKPNKPLVHYLVPLPPGLHASSAELFGFFTYELRVGHKKGWSIAQARYGRALRTTGVQHPPPQLFCIVQRNKKHIMVNAPYAQTVFNGANVTTAPPRTQLWALLYAQVRRADGNENRNILLDDQLFIRKRPVKNAAGLNIIDINTDAVQYGITGWRNKDVEKMLLDYGLPVDSNLSVLVVEMMPTYEKFFARPANQNTAVLFNRSMVFDNANLKQGMFIKHFSNAVDNLTASAAQVQLRLEENRQLKLEEGFISQAEKEENIRPLTEQLGSERILRTSTLVPVPEICCVE